MGYPDRAPSSADSHTTTLGRIGRNTAGGITTDAAGFSFQELSIS
jgi:hypothetical protein